MGLHRRLRSAMTKGEHVRRLRLQLCGVLGATALTLAACSGEQPPPPPPPTTAAFLPPPEGTGRPDGELVLGTLLPGTGALAYLGPGTLAGVRLAVTEINAAGGVLQKPVRVADADSGDAANNVAPGSVDQLFTAKADAIVGAPSSGVSLTVLEKVTSAGVPMVSPAATAGELTTADRLELFYRTVPADELQATALATTAAEDGVAKLAILARGDSYGSGLADGVERAFRASGGEVATKISYDPAATTFADEVGRVRTAAPDAIVLASFGEAAAIVTELTRQGAGPKAVRLYVAGGGLLDTYDLPRGALAGVTGTRPGARPSAQFRQRLRTLDPALTDFSYAAEAYDAAVLLALAAVKTGSDAGQQVADQLVAVSRDGEKCTDFAACTRLLAAGTDIDYDGPSGPLTLDDGGDVVEADLGLYRYGTDNRLDFVRPVRAILS